MTTPGGMRSLPRRVKSSLRKLARSGRWQARELLSSGAFDAGFYRAIAGLPDASDLDAARHYVEHGLPQSVPPHPLIELAYFPIKVRDAIRQPDGAERLLRYLRHEAASRHAWGPLFEPRSPGFPDAPPLTTLRRLRGEDAVPVAHQFQGPIPTLAQAREAAVSHAALLRAQAGRALTRLATWDSTAESAFLASAPRPVDGPLVSVIMPAWNREQTIVAAISSVRAQSYRNWELLVVDDGSADGTVEAARQQAAGDARISVISRPHGGVARARNAALAAARGEFVAFLDSDNTWRPDYLSLQVGALIARTDAVATFSGIRMFGEGMEDRFRGGDITPQDLQYGNSVDMNVLTVRASALAAVGHFDESLKRWVDYDMVLRLAARGPLAYLPFIGCDYLDEQTPSRITELESPNWQYVVMAKHALDWREVDQALAERVEGLVSVVTIAFQDYARTTHAVDRVLESTGEQDVEVVIVDNGSAPEVGRSLSQRYLLHPRVRYRRLAFNLNFATGSNVGFAATRGEHVLFLNNDTEVRDGWLEPLRERLTGSAAFAVQPLLVHPNGTVQSAGTLFTSPNGYATHFLANHPVQDALRHDGEGFSAITAAAMLIRADDFARLRGFDPIYANGYEDVDFCLRAKAEHGAMFAVEHRSRVVHEESVSPGRFEREAVNQRVFRQRWADRTPGPELHHYERLGFSWSHLHASTFPAPVLERRPRSVDLSGRGSTPSLRWAIKIGANASAKGDRWGDVPYADDLARALAELGQEVVIDRYGAFKRPMSYLDDVVLTIRGAHAVPPQPGRVNVLWVISRAERVTVDEIAGYDIVFAASPRWAAWMAERSGRPIEVLLQATAPERFNPSVEPSTPHEDLLFVGGPRTLEGGRPVVDAALAAGARVGVWGPRWESKAPAELLRGDYLDFDKAPSHYRGCDIVLNDHMDSMLEWGFINNRAFDAVATGTPVISDAIEGLDLFGGAVRGAGTPEEVADAIRDRSWIPDADAMARISARIRDEHSFARRAEVLLDRVLALRASLAAR